MLPVLSIVACFLFFSYIPVGGWQTWQDVAAHRIQESPDRLPLSQGIRSIEIGAAGNWLIQSLYLWAGAESLAVTFALVQTLTLILLSIAVYRYSKQWLAVVLTPLVFTAGAFFETQGLNRATFGLLMFSGLVVLLADWTVEGRGLARWSGVSRWRWLAVTVWIVAWANLHVSFAIGLIVLLANALGRIGEHRGPIFSDDEFRARIWLLELAWVATLLTPLGISQWTSALWWPDNPIIQQLGGWQTTSLSGWHGGVIAIMWAAWIVASRFSTKIGAATTSAAIAMTTLTAVCSHGIVWFVPVMLIAIADLVPQKTAAASRFGTGQSNGGQPLRFVYSLLALLLIWIGVCFSPTGSLLLGKPSRPTQQVVGPALPLGATAYLAADRKGGLIWCPAYWSGWLQTSTDLAVFANMEMGRLPKQVVDDYQTIYSGHSNWNRLADQYAVTTIVADKRRQPDLFRQLRVRHQDWDIRFEDSLAVVARRIVR